MARFSLANLFGDPFALVTVSISIIGIVVSLIASIMVNLHDSYPNYAWWSIAFMICITAGVIFIIGTNKIHLYGTALVGYLSASFVFTTLAVNSFIYSSQKPADQAAAAGFILLCAVNAVWIFYFGSATQSTARKFLDSYSLQKEVPRYDTGSKVSGFHARPETTTSHPPQMYTSQISGGFEASTPLSGFPSAPSGPNRPISPGAPISPALHQDDAEVSQPTEYPYRAKAIYSYEANPDDANEISFTKHEILEVSDVSGRWWQARKTNGDVGIAPSNYLILL